MPSEDDDEYRPFLRRSTRSKRKKVNHEEPVKAKRERSSPPTVVPHQLEFSLQPLLDAQTLRYAEEISEDESFEDVAGELIEEYARVRTAYLAKLPKDEQGRLFEPLSEAHEARLIAELQARREQNRLPAPQALLLRKLKLQQHRRIHSLPSPMLHTAAMEPLVAMSRPPKASGPPAQVLDALHAIRTTPYDSSFLSRICGTGDTLPEGVVFADWEARAPWVELMEDVRSHYAIKYPARDVPDQNIAAITYVTLNAAHLPQVHNLLRRTFWDGVNVTDSLHYEPEKATIIATYKRLVVGCAILSSPQETYITYLAVRAGWEQAQIATTMLYYLIARNPNKDITLHVSANNPAMLLYNRFGFKAEEFVVGFYADYLDPSARASKNAFRLRLRS